VNIWIALALIAVAFQVGHSLGYWTRSKDEQENKNV